MHEKTEKRFKIDFFANFRKLQKKLPICKKMYAEILNVARAVVTNVEKNSNRYSEFFLVPQKSRQSVVFSPVKFFGPLGRILDRVGPRQVNYFYTMLSS